MNNKVSKYFTKILICICITLSILIANKSSDSIKKLINKYIMTDTFNFMAFNNWYTKIIKFKNPKVQLVSSEMFNYIRKEKINNYEKYEIEKETVINSLTSGIVIYVGSKDNLGNTVIIQGSDGFDIWYSNIENINVSLYDYIDAKTIIGEASNYIYLTITKDNKYFTYEEYKKI